MDSYRLMKPLGPALAALLAMGAPLAAHADFEVTGYNTFVDASTSAIDGIENRDQDALQEISSDVADVFNPFLEVSSESPGGGVSSTLLTGGIFSVINSGLPYSFFTFVLIRGKNPPVPRKDRAP